MIKSEYEIVPEYALSNEDRNKCYDLIGESYNTTAQQTVIEKQKPSFRVLRRFGDEIIAHTAIEFRNVNMNGELISIFGIKELCVSLGFQRKGYASGLVQVIKKMLYENGVDAIFLFAPDKKLYSKHKFATAPIKLRWTFIQSGSSLGILEREFEDDCMIYPNKKTLPKKLYKDIVKQRKLKVDLLGHVF